MAIAHEAGYYDQMHLIGTFMSSEVALRPFRMNSTDQVGDEICHGFPTQDTSKMSQRFGYQELNSNRYAHGSDCAIRAASVATGGVTT